jgi:hypothetical protein
MDTHDVERIADPSQSVAAALRRLAALDGAGEALGRRIEPFVRLGGRVAARAGLLPPHFTNSAQSWAGEVQDELTGSGARRAGTERCGTATSGGGAPWTRRKSRRCALQALTLSPRSVWVLGARRRPRALPIVDSLLIREGPADSRRPDGGSPPFVPDIFYNFEDFVKQYF